MFSVFLPFTASDYPFVIFKQFSSIDQTYINYAAGTSSFSKDSMYRIPIKIFMFLPEKLQSNIFNDILTLK
jgi:hypothetical protein